MSNFDDDFDDVMRTTAIATWGVIGVAAFFALLYLAFVY